MASNIFIYVVTFEITNGLAHTLSNASLSLKLGIVAYFLEYINVSCSQCEDFNQFHSNGTCPEARIPNELNQFCTSIVGAVPNGSSAIQHL